MSRRARWWERKKVFKRRIKDEMQKKFEYKNGGMQIPKLDNACYKHGV